MVVAVARIRSKEGKAMNHETITVCDNCLQESCWNGVLYCDQYKTAGTIQKEIADDEREHGSGN